jgi:uncharacterized membrane protein
MTLGAAAVLLAIALPLIWHKRAPRFTAWLLLFSGLGLATVVIGLVGGIGSWSLFGIAIATPLTAALIVMFYLEVIKKSKIHRVRTPVIAFALGVLLVGLGGNVGGAISHSVQNIGNRVGTNTTQLINHQGP